MDSSLDLLIKFVKGLDGQVVDRGVKVGVKIWHRPSENHEISYDFELGLDQSH